MARSIVRILLMCPLILGSLAAVSSLSTDGAGATSPTPYTVALVSCFETYSAQFGVSYQVRVDVDAYNLPATADGYTLGPSGSGVAIANTHFYLYPDGYSYGAVNPSQMNISNGQGWGASDVDASNAGPFGAVSGWNVTVLYNAPGGPIAGQDSVTSVHVTVPSPSQCGTSNATSASAIPGTSTGSIVGMASTTDGGGYWMVGSDGRVYSYGDASNFYDQNSGSDYLVLNKPIVGMTATPDGHGYWLVASDGGIFAYGDAAFYGSTGGMTLNKPIVGMAATADGKGYWLVASDGGIFAYGDAQFYGSTGSIQLNQPIVGMAADGVSGGYWLVASDGGIFSYNAPFLGSTGSIHLNKPIVGMEAAPDGSGYRFVASDGGVFCYGLPFAGSTGSITLNRPITAMAPSGTGGYWLGAADGGIFNFGTGFYGSAA
ncbi:MAG TPA: hypothetical protein VGG09_03830 [Acidimicrobiales bacterium]